MCDCRYDSADIGEGLCGCVVECCNLNRPAPQSCGMAREQSDGHHINTSQSQYSVAQAEAECMVYNILVCTNVSVDSNGSA